MQPNDGRVVSNFIVQALAGGPLVIYGDGSQTRSFCYVDDLIDGLIALMATPRDVTGPVNLGRPGEYSILQLAAMVVKTVGGDIAIRHMPLPRDDPKRREPDITLAKRILGWEPKTSLDEGLSLTVQYFRSLQEKGNASPVELPAVSSELAAHGDRR
jgi:UDP-glucuronate decarboxylase